MPAPDAAGTGAPVPMKTPGAPPATKTAATPTVALQSATPLPEAEVDLLREKIRQLAESYVALVRAGETGEAWRYLPKDLQAKIPETRHAAWWRSAVSNADLPRVYVGAVAVEPGGGVVSLVTPSRSYLLDVIGTESPGLVPSDLLREPAAAGIAGTAADWEPLAPGTSTAFSVQRETVVVTSSASDLGQPEWRERLTGVLREDVIGPDKTIPGLGAILVKADRPVNKADDASIPETRRTWLRSTPRGLVIAAEADSDDQAPAREKSEPELLPAKIAAGAKWSGGTANVGGVSFPLAFTITACNTRVAATMPSGCIEVQGAGAGTARAGDGVMRGEISLHRWYAKGEGLVREIRQESLRRTTASGASFERTKMTVHVKLPRLADHVLAFAVNSREIARTQPSNDASGGPISVVPRVSDVPGSAPEAGQPVNEEGFRAARDQARSEMQARGAEWEKSGKIGTIHLQANVETVHNEDGTVSYKPNVTAEEHTVPTPTVYLGSGGE